MDFRKELKENILKFWLDNSIDYKNGGIYTCLDRQGNIYGKEKSVWFQGRALWVLAKAYNTIEKSSEYLRAAKCIYDFLPKCTDTDNRMYFTVTDDGRPIQKRRYYFSETFAAIGCAEYYKATGDKSVLDRAVYYFDTAYKCFTGKIKCAPKFVPENHSYKALSPVMIMLSTAQVMMSTGYNTDIYAKIADACLDEILHGGFLTENALFENVSPDGKAVDTPTGRKVNPGHSMEAAWFVICQGLLTGNNEALEAGKRIIDITLPLGWDKAHGGIIAFTDAYGKPATDLEWDMKLWWPQCETMIAARLAYTLFGDEKYNKLYRDVKEYCEKYFIDRECGEWYGYLHYDNTPSSTLKGNIFKGPFHIPRLYIIMAIMDETGSIEKFMK
ncbi:MAG: AGE family epimerase/isomerase [Clostridia bacterium]|nr:AGE family epimerase/isomerase [Clostridia bacterium]